MLEKWECNIRPTGSNPFIVIKEKPQKAKEKQKYTNLIDI
jgi:hypothetical protein